MKFTGLLVLAELLGIGRLLATSATMYYAWHWLMVPRFDWALPVSFVAVIAVVVFVWAVQMVVFKDHTFDGKAIARDAGLQGIKTFFVILGVNALVLLEVYMINWLI